MDTLNSPRQAATRPRSRKSITHIPSTDATSDKENLTVDTAGLASVPTQSTSRVKKSRSKSIGPGGLDALYSDAGNRRKSPTAPQYKSILKPSIPLSPPKAIPPRNLERTSSSAKSEKSATPGKPREGLLIDVSTPEDAFSITGNHTLPNPFGELSGSTALEVQSPSREQGRSVIHIEEEQQASAKERERQELIARRNTRRKSLANRRVSFAPEATLHTWDVVEMPEDSTTSSASTNTTRRASGFSAATVSSYLQQRSPAPNSDVLEPPSTPPQQAEEIQVAGSPAHQRDLHQKKRRRSSGIPPMDFNNPNDFSSSPDSVKSTNSGDSNHTFMTAEEDGDSSDSDDKDLVEDETIRGVDGEDVTKRSTCSSSTGSSGRLEEALRQAARQAGTQGIEYDENGDITMEMADDEATAASKPWTRSSRAGTENVANLSASQDQENLNTFSPAFKAEIRDGGEDKEEIMDLTQAVGMILPPARTESSLLGQSPQEARTIVPRDVDKLRRSSGASSVLSDETMDLTVAVGGIQNNQRTRSAPRHLEKFDVEEEDAEATMEFTSVVGGVLGPGEAHARCDSGESLPNEEDMDLTVAGGGILQSIAERTEPVEDDTVGMDITTAIGAILPEQLKISSNAQAKDIMEQETNKGQLSGSSLYREAQKTPEAGQSAISRTFENVKTIASETGSPSLIVTEGRESSKRSVRRSASVTPKLTSRQSTPLVKPITPSKQLTPTIPKPTTPGKTPPPKNVAMRTGSPKKLFEAEIKQEARISNAKADRSFLQPDLAANKIDTPSLLLKPRSRRSSGLGVDRVGIGSPRVTELLEGRGSIVEDAETFLAHTQPRGNVRFIDPQLMEREVDQERTGDQKPESGREFLQREADDQDLEHQKDATINLKNMIESLTPQKKNGKLNGRKSLHVGAAKGLLGKRPVELVSEEDEEDNTPKRLRGREASPVKKIKLPASPLKSATTGRKKRSSRASLAEMEVNARLSTPTQENQSEENTRVMTPKDQPRFRDAETHVGSKKGGVQQLPLNGRDFTVSVAPQHNEEPIRLQDFLNLTSIRFMELTTTKRRHTIAPNGSLDNSEKAQAVGAGDTAQLEAGSELESCVVAGACTLPILDLYQHSCRELKKYISEGRTVVREIEDETFEENPPLFHEYMNAPPDIKAIMDSQFKNVKTHARLLSKAMWYEWRMKLLDGLKEGLLKNDEGMQEDAKDLMRQEQLIQPILPGLMETHDELEAESRNLEAQAVELASCDQNELRGARSNLMALEEEVVAKCRLFEDLQTQLNQKENNIDDATERRQEHIAEIEEAEKVRHNCQGLDMSEVAALQASVADLEQEYGWTITSAAEATLTMTYKRTLQLFFTPQSFQSDCQQVEAAVLHSNAPISLAYVADAHEHHPQPLTTEKRFFLQILRAQLQFLDQPKVKVSELLSLVSSSWEKACSIAEEARLLGVLYITEPIILSDETLAIKSAVLLKQLKTKVDVTFKIGIQSRAEANGIDIVMKPSAKAVYGEELNAKKMGDFLEKKVDAKSNGRDRHDGQWAQAVKELEQRLVARGKRP